MDKKVNWDKLIKRVNTNLPEKLKKQVEKNSKRKDNRKNYGK